MKFAVVWINVAIGATNKLPPFAAGALADTGGFAVWGNRTLVALGAVVDKTGICVQ